MRKNKWLLAAVAVFAILGIGVWILHLRLVAASSVFLTTASPSLTYTVKVAGQKDRPRFPAVVHSVTFSVTKRSEVFLVDEYLHSGDWLDPSFAILYPQHNWPSENILHLYREEYFSGSPPCKVIIRNNSGETIKYLRVVSHNAHLLFDIQPESQPELTIPPPRGDLLYISVAGQFSEARAINKVGENFVVGRQPLTFYIDLHDGFATIQGVGLKTYPSR